MTSVKSSVGIGDRVSKYRKMAGLSAQQVSDRTGGEMSRSVIANIESGRKTEVTVDQLIALAWALDVNPVVLALPVDAPYKTLSVAGEAGVLPTLDAVRWWLYDEPDRIYRKDDEDSPSMLVTRLMIGNLRMLGAARGSLQMANMLIELRGTDPELEASIASNKSRIEEAERDLKSLGVDITSPESE